MQAESGGRVDMDENIKRAIANCDAEPIPESWEEREELWTFELHDSEWAAID